MIDAGGTPMGCRPHCEGGEEMAAVTVCVGRGHEARDALAGAGEGVETLLVRLVTGTTDPDVDWVQAGAVSVIQAMQEIMADATRPDLRRVAVLVWPDEPATAREREAIGATVEAMRGIVQSLTLEIDPDQLRLNVVIGAGDRVPDVKKTLDLLAADRGDYLAGATIDVR
jgi:hypothetical protein